MRLDELILAAIGKRPDLVDIRTCQMSLPYGGTDPNVVARDPSDVVVLEYEEILSPGKSA
jgi:hypothetical protein